MLPVLFGGGALTQIYNQTLTAPGQFTVPNIPQGYNDLLGIFTGSSNANAATDTLDVQFNGDSAANYNSTIAVGTNTAATQFSQNTWDAAIPHSGIAASTLTGYATLMSLCWMYIPRYSSTAMQKIIKSMGTEAFGVGSGAVNTLEGTCLWNSTAAITSMFLEAGATPFTFVTGSQFRLYGVQ